MNPTRGIRHVLAVTVLALVAFGVAVVALGDDARRGCVVDAPFDPAYQARLLTRGKSEILMAETEHEIELTRDGAPVTGAKVCARVFMVGMEAMGSSDSAAEELGGGVYRVTILFVMTGGWTGNILIEEPGKSPASVTVNFEVI